MQCHEERVAVHAMGDLDMNGSSDKASKNTAVSFGRTASELDAHRAKIVHSNKGERRVSCHSSFTWKICHLLADR